MTDPAIGCAKTPLSDLLRRIPQDAVYSWANPEEGRQLWQLGSESAPIGRLAHEAADALDAVRAVRTPALEGEVVAWRVREQPETGWLDTHDPEFWRKRGWEVQPLYASPVVPVGREEIAVAAVLREVLDWIDNWLPAFIQDNEWTATRAKADAILAALGTKGADHD
jgi:hypothetical protein